MTSNVLNIKYAAYNSPLGKLAIGYKDECLYSIDFRKTNNFKSEKSFFSDSVNKQLQEYFLGSRRRFDIKIKLEGTDFQLKVWRELLKIPYGQTRNYEEIAIAIGNRKACRAIGNANNKNPIPIIIPCHRVIGKNKKLVGYAGGLEIKEKLLEIEK